MWRMFQQWVALPLQVVHKLPDPVTILHPSQHLQGHHGEEDRVKDQPHKLGKLGLDIIVASSSIPMSVIYDYFCQFYLLCSCDIKENCKLYTTISRVWHNVSRHIFFLLSHTHTTKTVWSTSLWMFVHNTCYVCRHGAEGITWRYIQWNLVIKRSDITKPSYNKVILLVPDLYIFLCFFTLIGLI